MKSNYFRKKLTRNTRKVAILALVGTMGVIPVLCTSEPTYAAVASYGVTTTDSVKIVEAQGYLESAAITWQPVAGVSGYRVYYKAAGTSDSAYQLLDDQLIREYSAYIRADVVGLPVGNYTVKVVPLFTGKENASKAGVTSNISVKAHTREGFAFSKASPMGTGSGGYNDDGSVPSNAHIIYITSENVNTVKLDVVTNSKGTVTACTGLVDILAKRQKGYDKTPLIIRMVGTIKDTEVSGLNSDGYIQVKGSYNTTFEGIGEDATVNGWGLLIRDSHNVEIRNIGVMLFKDDGISLDTGNENIWVHNNDIFYGSAGSDADQAKGDGSCDVKGLSTYVTIAYNHFWDSGKSSLCGMSDTQEFFVTYHHNWFDHSDSRHPRIRVGTVHIYNNYFDGNSKYGVGLTKGGSAFVEANDFRNCKYPMLISMQGTDIADGSVGTFSKEPGGMIKAYNNKIQGAKSLIYQTENGKQFDAYLASSRNEKVPTSYQTISGSNTYNNFDTNAAMYSYQPDAPETVRSEVTTYAGRVNGGDFNWTFTEADDTDYGVNAGLMSAIRSYKTSLIKVGGESLSNTSQPSTDSGDSGTGGNTGGNTGDNTGGNTGDNTGGNTGDNSGSTEETQVQAAHNFTESGLDSTFFSMTGNLSTSKGTVSYDGMTLTQCLKMESKTSITFTTTAKATLTLVLNADFNGNVAVDNVKYQAAKGIITVTLPAGSHEIKKADTGNLFYLSVK